CRIITRLASHARRCDVSAETCVPSSRRDWPGASGSASTWASTWTTTWYRSPGAPGSIPEWRAVSASRASASACCWAMATLLVQRLACSGQRLHEQSADLRRQSAADDHHAVLVLIHVQRPARLPPGGLASLGIPIHQPPPANDPLDVLGGAGPTHLNHPRFDHG